MLGCRNRRFLNASNCLKRGSASRCSSGPTADSHGNWPALLNHVQQVRLLERDLQTLVPALDEEGLPERLRIALNADSLGHLVGAGRGGFLRGTTSVDGSGGRRPDRGP